MVGLERAVLPLVAAEDFGLASRSAALSFIVTFGLVKAVANLFAGRFGDRIGRKRILVLGWVAGVPVPLLVMWAPSWGWIVAANVLLGLNQGLAWSMTVLMKIDLVGPQRRGLATGLNEFAGYLAVAGAALASGVIASRYGLRPEPFYLGIGFAAAGLALSAILVKDTIGHVRAEERSRAPSPRVGGRGHGLASCYQAGLVNNLNDGLAWGLFPLLFASAGVSVDRIGLLAASYPAAWGMGQLGAGALSDRWGRKWLAAGGMVLQGLALLAVAGARGFEPWLLASLFLGLGTAMAYPTLLAAVGDLADPAARGAAVGAYRFWRDSGYALGAIAAGMLADRFGIPTAIAAIGVLTVGSGLALAVWMPETLARRVARDTGRWR
jgi:MFS family permease